MFAYMLRRTKYCAIFLCHPVHRRMDGTSVSIPVCIKTWWLLGSVDEGYNRLINWILFIFL